MTALPTHPLPVTVRVFTQRFSSTRLGARLARLLALHQLDRWGIRYGTDLSDTVAVLVAELAANAITHGRTSGRDFELRFALTPAILRIDVSDSVADRRPPASGRLEPPCPLADSGRGLLLVEALADRWEVLDRVPIGKIIRAELDLPHLSR